jgi:acetyl/propionyl-CoA carboxylase alpha subunit
MVTGFDLVAATIKRSRGEELGLTQDDIKMNGHASYRSPVSQAEDPAADFLPATARLISVPAEGDGIRIDSGLRRARSFALLRPDDRQGHRLRATQGRSAA